MSLEDFLFIEEPYVPYRMALLADKLNVSSQFYIKDYFPEVNKKIIIVTTDDFFSGYYDGNNWIREGGGIIDYVINWYEVEFT